MPVAWNFNIFKPALDAFLTVLAEGSESATGGAPAQQRLSKTTVGFVENLNAKLAEQRLSGKAYAVRSLINSKALVIKGAGL